MAAFLAKLFGIEEIDPTKPRKYTVEYMDYGQQGKPIQKQITINLPPNSLGKTALELVESQIRGNDQTMALFGPVHGGHYKRPTLTIFGHSEVRAITSKATRTIQPAGNWVFLEKPLVEQGVLHSMRYEPIIQPVPVKVFTQEKPYMLNVKEESHLALAHVLKEEGLWNLAPYVIFSFLYANAPHYLSPKESILSQIPSIKTLSVSFFCFPPIDKLSQLNPKELEMVFDHLVATSPSYGPDPTRSAPSDRQNREDFRLETLALKHQAQNGDFSCQQQSFLGSLLKNFVDFNAKRDEIWKSLHGMSKTQAQIEYIKKWSTHPNFGLDIFSTKTLFVASTKLFVTPDQFVICKGKDIQQYDWDKFLTAYSVVSYRDGQGDNPGHWVIDHMIIRFIDHEEKIFFDGRRNETVVSFLWACYGVRLLRGIQRNPFIYPEDQAFSEVDPPAPTAMLAEGSYHSLPFQAQAFWTVSMDYMPPHSDTPPSYNEVVNYQ